MGPHPNIFSLALALLPLASCTRYAPPDWLQGDWTTGSEANDTAWFEWGFREGEVVRREFLNRELSDELLVQDVGAREGENTDEV